ncbi:ATP-grasp domain-containing protein [Pseudonocardia sp. TRM90224]|uniref:ATP-grasp domain-containing protein n=1 Tax=Pseudonocardia sp. TRM90224 TaxID=2812678 RepID=UPI001E60C191|nr:ATP-grasp domain-containing protein [Pseudonocardia sp. TRM90224]
MILIVPHDVMRPRRPDEHFAAEADAARTAGWTVALVDHDALAAGEGVDRATARVPAGTDAVYRGWMLSSTRYAGFADALGARGTVLRTDAARYRRAHELPGWYAALADVTPETAWTVGTDRADFERACRELGAGPAVLRDYTKSMKHYWDEAAFVPDVADPAAAWRVASRFAELREHVEGGFALRRFERFVGAEARSWWVDGTCRLVTAHPDTPDAAPPADLETRPFAPLVAGLDLAFVTLDLALRADGVWRVIELGDGQVSDRPAGLAADELIGVLARP